MNPDFIEAFLWGIATYFSFRSAINICISKSETNVYWPGWLFYTIYETWKFAYYFNFGQWYSVAVNVVMVSSNFIAIAAIFRIRGYWPFKIEDKINDQDNKSR